jgi:diaminopimelate epimerase
MSLQLPFTKLVGTGNDFLFIDARLPTPWSIERAKRPDLVRRICDRHFGVGADGVVFVELGAKSKNVGELCWDFYNSDGSTAEMCGNATRCMGRFLFEVDQKTTANFSTIAGLVKTEVHADEVTSHLPFVHAILNPISFEINGQDRRAFLVDTGVPHAVIEVFSLEAARQSRAEIAALRFHSHAGANGANVTFLIREEAHVFSTVTYERGVEDFTLSCGTGVLAAAAVGLSTEKSSFEADVRTPGGRLHVKYAPGFSGVWLSGPAKVVCTGHISI